MPTPPLSNTSLDMQKLDIFNCLVEQSAIINTDGTILDINHAWRKFALENGNPRLTRANIGVNYFQICEQTHGPDREVALAVANAIREVIRGNIMEFTSEYACHSPDQRRWFILRVVRLNATSALVLHIDITRRVLQERQTKQYSTSLEKRLNEREIELETNEARLRWAITAYTESQRMAILGTWTLNLANHTVILSQQAAKIFGLPLDQKHLPFQEFLLLSSEDDQQVLRDSIETALSTKQTVCFQRQVHRYADQDIRVANETITLVGQNENQIEEIVVIVKDITEETKHREMLTFFATHDYLTNLPNRNLFADRLQQCLAKERRERTQHAVLFVDLDKFKEINDTHGHAMGDQVLIQASQRLAHCIREYDTLARIGGDEFVILIDRFTDQKELVTVAKRIIKFLSLPYEYENNQVFCGTSIGIACSPQDGRSSEEILKAADFAMYEAKRGGPNRYCFFNDRMRTKIDLFASLSQQLRRAVRQSKGLYLMYQPQVDLTNGVLVAIEALARWRLDEHTVVMPGTFIPLAEENGLIEEVGEWILKETWETLNQWQQQYARTPRLAFNLSAMQFQSNRFTGILNEYACHADHVSASMDLELTESAIMNNPSRSAKLLTELRENGMHVALDDFGTGYSSLSYLCSIPLDCVKIDRSFVSPLVASSKSRAVLLTILQLIRTLGLKSIAEGIETEEQAAFLKRHDCDIGQGFLYAKPMNDLELAPLLDQYSSDPSKPTASFH